jgi:YaiO family outer membrane protein
VTCFGPGTRTPRTAGHVALAALTLFCGSALLAQVDDVLARARQLASGNRRSESLALLEKRLEQTPGDVDARLLYGLVLSWERRFDDARRQLTAVLAAAPGYADARYALGNVELWSGHPDRAESLAREGLGKGPNDNRLLLLRARALRRRDAEAVTEARQVLAREPANQDAKELVDSMPAAALPWTVTFTETHEWFSRDIGAWDELRAGLRRSTGAGPVIASFSRSYRSGVVGQQIEIELYPRLRRGTYAYLELGYSPDARLYPERRGAVDLFQTIGRGFELSGYRRLGFASPVNIYTGSLGKYYRQWLFIARGYGISDKKGVSETAQFAVRRYFATRGDYAGVRFSRGSILQEVTNVTDLAILKSTSVEGELEKSLGPRWRFDVRAGRSHEDRLNAGTLNRYFMRGGLALRF